MTFPVRVGTWIDNAGWYLLLLGSGIPGVVALWRRQRQVVLYVAVAFAVLVVWAWSSRRFLHPLMPLVAVAFTAGASTVGQKLGGKAGRLLGPLVVLALLLPRSVRETAAVMQVGLRCERDRVIETCFLPAPSAFLRAAVYGRTLPDSAMVLAEREAAFAWHSGRPAIHASTTLDASPESFVPVLRKIGITHVLITSLSMNERVRLAARLHANCRTLDLLQGFGENTYLFRLRAPSEASSDEQRSCTATMELDRIGREIAHRVEEGEVE
jgi:hypothetical protein